MMVAESKNLHKEDEYVKPELISHGKINVMMVWGTQLSDLNNKGDTIDSGIDEGTLVPGGLGDDPLGGDPPLR